MTIASNEGKPAKSHTVNKAQHNRRNDQQHITATLMTYHSVNRIKHTASHSILPPCFHWRKSAALRHATTQWGQITHHGLLALLSAISQVSTHWWLTSGLLAEIPSNSYAELICVAKQWKRRCCGCSSVPDATIVRASTRWQDYGYTLTSLLLAKQK